MTTRCAKQLFRGFSCYPCSRGAAGDSIYCRQHNPENIAARRDAASKRYDAKRLEADKARRFGVAREAKQHVCEPCKAKLDEWARGQQ